MLNILQHIWPLLLAATTFILAASATVHAVLNKRDVRAVIGWVGLIWMAPLLGPIAYFCLGVNRIRRNALSLQVGEAWTHDQGSTITPQDIKFAEHKTENYPNLLGLGRLGKAVTGKGIRPGNTVVPLANGDEAYPEMVKAIDAAEHSVAMLSYIFDNDRAGEFFMEALLRAQERGVSVRVLIDHVGSRYTRPTMVERLGKAGLRVRAFLPTRAGGMLKYANLRNHRKILVTDGKVGFTGGTNIREGHWLSLNPKAPVQCLHFKLQGPVVKHLQEAFALDWAFASGESIHGETWFPEVPPEGPVWARGIADGPDEDFEVLLNIMVGALAAATQRVSIITPYFLPDSTLIHTLAVTAMRGVEVNIVVPAKNNLTLVQWASTAQFSQLLDKGCKIHLSPAPFDHTKLMVIDGAWSLIGSTNWDPRSLRLNFEYNVECFDEELAGKLEAVTRAKIAAGHEVNSDELAALSLPIRLRNGLARLLTPYL